MKTFLHTYFFGYVKLKWMRLIRTLLILVIPITFVFKYEIFYGIDDLLINLYFLLLVSIYTFTIFLISWLIVPFVNTKNV